MKAEIMHNNHKIKYYCEIIERTLLHSTLDLRSNYLTERIYFEDVVTTFWANNMLHAP